MGNSGYRILYSDGFGGFGTEDLVSVVVTLPPNSSHPVDVTIMGNETGSFQWVLTDDMGGGQYCVKIGSRVWINWHVWENDSAIVVPIDSRFNGTFTYTLNFTDCHGVCGLIDQVIVTVIPEPVPPAEETQSPYRGLMLYGGLAIAIAGIFWVVKTKKRPKR